MTDYAQIFRDMAKGGVPLEHLEVEIERHLEALKGVTQAPEFDEAFQDHVRYLAEVRKGIAVELIAEMRELIPNIPDEDLAAEQWAMKRAAAILEKLTGEK